jgi:hypothetical protein
MLNTVVTTNAVYIGFVPIICNWNPILVKVEKVEMGIKVV